LYIFSREKVRKKHFLTLSLNRSVKVDTNNNVVVDHKRF